MYIIEVEGCRTYRLVGTVGEAVRTAAHRARKVMHLRRKWRSVAFSVTYCQGWLDYTPVMKGTVKRKNQA